MRLRSDLKLPKEHGAWAMLYVPFAAGVLAAGRFHLALLLLLVSTTSVFIAREPMLEWYRARLRGREASRARRLAVVYLALGALLSLPLVVVYRLWWLLLPGCLAALLLAINLFQAGRREDRTVLGETTAIAGLTGTAAVAFYVADGTWDMAALLLWLMCGLYFGSSVFYVKLRVHWLNRIKARRDQSWRECALYHSLLAITLISLALGGTLSTFVLIAFAPVLARSFWHLARPSPRINLKRVGLLELLYSTVFLVFITLSFTAG